MAVVAKQSKAGTKKAIKQAAAPKVARVISEVDLLIARLKRFRKGQRAGFDLREAIEEGRD